MTVANICLIYLVLVGVAEPGQMWRQVIVQSLHQLTKYLYTLTCTRRISIYTLIICQTLIKYFLIRPGLLIVKIRHKNTLIREKNSMVTEAKKSFQGIVEGLSVE